MHRFSSEMHLQHAPSQRVTPLQRLGGLGMLSLIALLHFFGDSGWVRVLDDANLLIHEAGHPIFGLLGDTLGLYGGTLLQLLLPAVFAFYFYRRSEPLGAALCGGWFFENFWNIARYMADARAQALPLVGGGEHDWTQIFAAWHVLPHDIQIARGVEGLGWAGYLYCGFVLARGLGVKPDAVR